MQQTCGRHFSLELINGKMSHGFKAQQQKFIINSYAGFSIQIQAACDNFLYLHYFNEF